MKPVSVLNKFWFVLLGLLLNGLSFYAQASEPYFAHPKQDFEKVRIEHASFLLTESLHSIAMAYDANSERRREEILLKLSQSTALQTYFGLSQVGIREMIPRLRNSLPIWLEVFPSISTAAGQVAQVEWQAEEMLRLSHELMRLASQVSGVARTRDVGQILNSMSLGPHQMYQNGRTSFLQGALKDVCSDRMTALDFDPTIPKKFRWIRLAIQVGSGWLKEGASVFLGSKKTCESLAGDLSDIVTPHQSPLRNSPRRTGQLEATSVFLAKSFFDAQSSLPKYFSQLDSITRLNPALSLDAALDSALGQKLLAQDQIRLLNLASHNHGLELYLEKAALELDDNRERAVMIASGLLKSVNHLYGLLTQYYLERKAVAATDGLARVSRPYHYWGGALVACELVARGYSVWAATLVSGMLGQIYEGSTSEAGGEAIATKNEDSRLHMQGALDWGSRCLLNSSDKGVRE